MTRSTAHRRLEADREDLMREAKALRQRAEFRVPGDVEHVIAGYRSDGALSIYFGPDPCYHFNSDLQLRRAYVDGHLYRTQGTTLSRMHRNRSGGQVELRRHDLTASELESFTAQTREKLMMFAVALREANAECIQSIPVDSHIASRLRSDLTQMTRYRVELAPSIPGRD